MAHRQLRLRRPSCAPYRSCSTRYRQPGRRRLKAFPPRHRNGKNKLECWYRTFFARFVKYLKVRPGWRATQWQSVMK